MKYILTTILAYSSIYASETYPEEWERNLSCQRCREIRSQVHFMQNIAFDELYNNLSSDIEISAYDVKLSGKIEAYQQILNFIND